MSLQPSVLAGLPDIFAKWEGRGLPFMYTDCKGIVTCGTGNALFTAAAAEALAWVRPDGSGASKGEVDDAFGTVKAYFPKVQGVACERLTTLRLKPGALADLVRRTVVGDWAALVHQMSGADAWPADGQLFVLSSAWAWGSYFPNVWDQIGHDPADPDFYGYGTKFKALLEGDAPDFVNAAAVMRAASMHEEAINPGIVPRDAGEVVMAHNAAEVLAAGADRSKLWYPAEYA